MKKCFVILGLLTLAAVTARAETNFLKTLATEDFASAGLQKLTPEELAHLEMLFQRFKKGEVAEVRQQVEAKAQAVREEAEKKIMAAELKARAAVEMADAAVTKAKEVETKAEAVAATPAKSPPGWFKALLTLKKAGEKPEKEEALKSRLVGDFSGWNPKTVFTLENGSRWVLQNKTDRYDYSPALHSPAINITPATLSGFWLEVEGVNMNVRVLPLEMRERK